MSASLPSEPSCPVTDLLLAEELNLFLREYEKHYKPGESKPPEIGMPFLLRAPGSDTGVLLIHGLMAAPAEVREWAEFLHDGGLTVYAPDCPATEHRPGIFRPAITMIGWPASTAATRCSKPAAKKSW